MCVTSGINGAYVSEKAATHLSDKSSVGSAQAVAMDDGTGSRRSTRIDVHHDVVFLSELYTLTAASACG
jgi:hypothetical protein